MKSSMEGRGDEGMLRLGDKVEHGDTPGIPAFGRQRQKKCQFKASFIAKHYFKN